MKTLLAYLFVKLRCLRSSWNESFSTPRQENVDEAGSEGYAEHTGGVRMANQLVRLSDEATIRRGTASLLKFVNFR